MGDKSAQQAKYGIIPNMLRLIFNSFVSSLKGYHNQNSSLLLGKIGFLFEEENRINLQILFYKGIFCIHSYY